VEVSPETDTEVPPTNDVGTGGAPGREHGGTDGVPGVEVPEEIDDEKAVELVNNALDVAGLVPGPIGVFTDSLNVGIYAHERDWTNAGLSAAAVVLSLGVVGGVVAAVLIEGVIKISKTAMAKRGVKAAKEWIADAFKAGRITTKLVSSNESLEKFLKKVWEARDEIGRGRDKKRVYQLYNEVDPNDPNRLTIPRDKYKSAVDEIKEGRPRGAKSISQDGFDHFDRDGFNMGNPEHLAKLKERVYLNVNADDAPAVMNKVVKEIIDNPDEFPGVYKSKLTIEDYIGQRSEGIVIYTDSKEAADRVLAKISEYQSQNPTHFKKSVPWLTDQKAPGVSIGSEPINSGGEMSFGKLRSLAIQEALEEAVAHNKTEQWFKDRVLELFLRNGIDPVNPHLNRPPGGSR
jgi:hypothetical protein